MQKFRGLKKVEKLWQEYGKKVWHNFYLGVPVKSGCNFVGESELHLLLQRHVSAKGLVKLPSPTIYAKVVLFLFTIDQSNRRTSEVKMCWHPCTLNKLFLSQPKS